MEQGRYSQAADRFRRLIARGAGEALDPEARLNLLDCELRLHQLGAARSEVDRFLSKYPNSERLPELLFLRGELLRSSGQCGKALPDYAAALSSPRRGADALYFKAWCQQKTGDRDGAADSLRAYLDRYPSGSHAKEASAGLDALGRR
jgi:outer membrane protein assembly factor BamD (BamD/ComL family)